MSATFVLALTMMASTGLFDDTQVHEIWIHITARDYQSLVDNYDENTFYTCDVEWAGQRIFNVGIRSRGDATRNPMKPGFRLDFDRYVRGQEFEGLESLVLDNMWHDASMMRERLAMPLFERLGLPAPRESYARVYIGSRRAYAGLYAIVEDINERFVERHFREDAGYLFEYDQIDGYHLEDAGPSLDFYAERFKPKNHKTASMFDLYAPIREMVRVINETPVEALESAIEPFLDLDRVLAYLAAEHYLADWDGFTGDAGMANFYLYRFTGIIRSELIPWDKDNTFTALEFPIDQNMQLNALTRKIWAAPRLRARYLQKLLDVAAADEGWLEREAQRHYALIRESAYADERKSHTSEELEAAVAFILRFARERREWVREAIRHIRIE